VEYLAEWKRHEHEVHNGLRRASLANRDLWQEKSDDEPVNNSV